MAEFESVVKRIVNGSADWGYFSGEQLFPKYAESHDYL